MRIVVHGQQAFGKSVLEALLERGENVIAVYCAPDPKQGVRLDPLKEAALARHLLAESTIGISPGDRGMVGDSWCRLPLTTAKANERHISPVPLVGVVSDQSTHEVGTEP
jgi:hypothetical protein